MTRRKEQDLKEQLDYVKTNLYAFYRYYVARNFTENLPAKHIQALAGSLMEVYRGDYHRLCVAMPPRHKLANSTPILTTDGWKTHGELQVNDYVYGLDLEPTRIIGCSNESPCDRLITFTDGSQIKAHEDHLWSVYLNNEETLLTVPTSFIEDNLDTIDFKLPKVKDKNESLSITRVEKVEPENGKCIEIEDPDGIYLAGENLIPTHNSKSSMVTVAYPLWLLFHNPDLNIVIVNVSAALSEKFGIAIRELIKQYGAEFNVYLSDIKSSSTYLMFADEDKNLYGGSMRLVGAGGSITGQDVDYLIVDDPYEGFSDITPGLLEKKINWFRTIIEQRIEPQTRLIILHTRWHSDDLQGYLKENEAEKYHFITFPAIWPDGTPLWPERYSKEYMDDKKATLGPRLFNSIFQQQPLDSTSDFFDLSKINYHRPENYNTIVDTSTKIKIDALLKDKIITQEQYDVEYLKLKRNVPEAYCRSWDLASSDNTKGDRRDYTVGCLMYRTPLEQYVVSDIDRGQFGDNTRDEIRRTGNNDGEDTIILIETGVAAAGKLLFDEWESQLSPLMVEQSEPIGSKVDRATPLKNAILDGKIFFDIQDPELRKDIRNEFKSFPEGKHDDIVDSISYAFNYLNISNGAEYAPGFAIVNLRGD